MGVVLVIVVILVLFLNIWLRGKGVPGLNRPVDPDPPPPRRATRLKSPSARDRRDRR